MPRILDKGATSGALEAIKNASWVLFSKDGKFILSDGRDVFVELSKEELVALGAIVEAGSR